MVSPLVIAAIQRRSEPHFAHSRDLPFATQRSDDWEMGTVPLGVLDSKVAGKLTRAQRNQVLKALRKEDTRRRLAEARALLPANGEEADAEELR